MNVAVGGTGVGVFVAGAGVGVFVAGASVGVFVAGASVGVLVAGAGVGVMVAGAGVGVMVAGSGIGDCVIVGVGPVAVGVGVTVGRTAVRVTVGGRGVRVDVGALREGVRVGHGFRVWVGEGVCVGVVVSVSVGVVVSVSVDVGVSSNGVGVTVAPSAHASGVGVSVGEISSSSWSIPGWLLEAADGEIGLISIWSSACMSPSPSGGISQSSSKKMLARSSNEGIRAEHAVPSRDRSINANSTQARATLDRDRPFGLWPRNERKRLMPLFLGERNEIDIAVAGSNCLTQPSMLPAEPLQFSYAICPQ